MAEEIKTVKRFKKPLRIIVCILIFAALVFWFFFMLSSPCDRTNATYSDFVVGEDDSRAQVAQNLYENGIVKNAKRFELLANLSFAGKFRPGTYYLSPSENALAIMHTLTSGLTTSKGFTIPAGLTVEQIASELDRDGIADKDKFLEAAASPELLQIEVLQEGLDEHPNIKGTDVVEGFILPTDYTLSDNVDESMMIIMMVDAFSNFYNEDYRARADELGIDVRDVLCIASVIEKETAIDSERAKISAVLHNKYNLETLDKSEIYEVPLCSPSKESIIAALYPEDTEDTYYVLSDMLDGTHRFTSDEAEYNTWLEQYNEAIKTKAEEKNNE